MLNFFRSFWVHFAMSLKDRKNKFGISGRGVI